MFKKKPKPQAVAETPAPAIDGEDGAAPAKKKLPLKLIIIGGVAAVVVLGGGGTAAMLLLGGGGGEAHAQAGHAPRPAAAHGGGGEGGHGGGEGGAGATFGTVSEGPQGVTYYTLPDILADIQSSDGRPQHLKLKLTLELSDPTVADALEPNGPRLRDMFNSFLRELRPEDLQGSQGTYQLRQEIQRRVNLVIAPRQVNSVLIQEMLIQ